MADQHWVLSADISAVGKRRLKVLDENKADRRRTQSVDAQALEQIFNHCAASAVRDVENVLASLEESRHEESFAAVADGGDNNNSSTASKILMRYAVMSEAFQRERQANQILTEALQSALKAVEGARAELDDVRAERDALQRALQHK